MDLCRLPKETPIAKIPIGFTNCVYDIDNKIILKLRRDGANTQCFMVEVELLRYFEAKLPVPKLIFSEISCAELGGYPVMLYHKIKGENLYSVWHTFNDAKRKSIIKQLCGILKTINQTPLRDVQHIDRIVVIESWKKTVLDRIHKYLSVAKSMNSLFPESIESIKRFVIEHSSSLDEQQLALTYFDAHFDNVLVEGDQIAALLDFERTEITSIDFALDVVRRMVEFPTKYPSEQSGHFCKGEHYTHLLEWYEEYYPELFQFKNLKRRLDFYAIAHDLEDLENWPNVQSLKDNLLRIVTS